MAAVAGGCNSQFSGLHTDGVRIMERLRGRVTLNQNVIVFPLRIQTKTL